MDAMLGKLLRKLVTLPAEMLESLCDLLEKITDETWAREFKRFLRRETCWVKLEEAPVPEPLLMTEDSVTLPATKKQFVVAGRFVVDTGEEARVKIWNIWSEFTEWFGKLVEKPRGGVSLTYHTLLTSATIAQILVALGGEEKVKEIPLSAIDALMEQQRDGGEGALLNDDCANIFPKVRDSNGVLRAVNVCWDLAVGGWYVDADTLDNSVEWRAGRRVFSMQLKLEPCVVTP